jgi:anti-sigma B factor antagonist
MPRKRSSGELAWSTWIASRYLLIPLEDSRQGNGRKSHHNDERFQTRAPFSGGEMNLETEVLNDVVIIRVRESRLVFPQVEAFASTVKAQLRAGPRNLILNLSEVEYLDSPAHGYMFELYRFVTEGGGRMKLVGLRPRVEAMASLVGLTRIVEVLQDEGLALDESNAVRRRSSKLEKS